MNKLPGPFSRSILLFIAVFISLAGCEKTNQSIDLSKFSVDNYPRVDGSTSTEPLQTLVACRLLGVDYAWITFPWFVINYPYRIMPDCSEDTEVCSYITHFIHHYGTHDSYVNLIMDRTDLILVARTPSQDEIHLADSIGIQLKETPMALDAFVFLNNPKNPVNALTTSQIQDIYTGKISSWSDLGGNPESINAYQRNKNSGSQELMESLIMKDLQMIDLPDMIMQGMIGLINQVEYDLQGLGYSVNYYTRYMIRSDSIKLLSVDGIYPDTDMLKTRAYPYTTEVYVVIREDLDRNSTAYQLYELLISSEGQDLVEESGYIPYY